MLKTPIISGEEFHSIFFVDSNITVGGKEL
jgi:hypothetical protein